MANVYCDANLTTGANNGTSWADAYRGAGSLLTAIQKAVNNDIILVKNGNYSPVDYQTIKTISIIGESRDGCIIDGGAQFSVPDNLMEIGYLSAINITKTGVCCARFNGNINVKPSISIENFTFQNGQSTSKAGSWGAGGVKGAILKNCIVKNCISLSAQYGHGAGLIFCNAYNTIISNCIAAQGGGIYDSNLYDCSVLNCIGGPISANYRSHGGGMYNDTQKTILSNCLFDGCSVVIGNSDINGYAAAADLYSNVSAYNVEVRNCYNKSNGNGRALWLETTSNYAFNCKFHDTQDCDYCVASQANLICCEIYNCNKPFSGGTYDYCKIHDFNGPAGAVTTLKNSEIYNGYNDLSSAFQMFGQAGVWTNCYVHDISSIITNSQYNAGIRSGGESYSCVFKNILMKINGNLAGAIHFGCHSYGCTFDHCSAGCILNGQSHINDEVKNCNVAATASGSNALIATTSHPQRIINAKIHHNRANFIYAGNLKPQGYFRNCTFANNELSNSSGDCLWSNGWYNGGSSTLPADDQCYGMIENCVFYSNSVYPSKKYDMELPYRMRVRNCCIEPDTLTVTYAQGEQQGIKMNNWSSLSYTRDNSMIPENCIVADPMFNDPEHYDYTLKDGSPCMKSGIKDLDFYDPMYIQLDQPTNRLLYRISAYAPFDCDYHLWQDDQPAIGAHGDVVSFSKGLPECYHPMGGKSKKLQTVSITYAGGNIAEISAQSYVQSNLNVDDRIALRTDIFQTYDGKSILGWTMDPESTEIKYTNGQRIVVPNTNITLYPIYGIETISYSDSSIRGVESQSVPYAAQVHLRTDIMRTYSDGTYTYPIAGWTNDSSKHAVDYADGGMISTKSQLTIYPRYTATITYSGANRQGTINTSYTSNFILGGSVTLRKDIFRKLYNIAPFRGWSTTKNTTVTTVVTATYTDGQTITPTANLTIYPLYTKTATSVNIGMSSATTKTTSSTVSDGALQTITFSLPSYISNYAEGGNIPADIYTYVYCANNKTCKTGYRTSSSGTTTWGASCSTAKTSAEKTNTSVNLAVNSSKQCSVWARYYQDSSGSTSSNHQVKITKLYVM